MVARSPVISDVSEPRLKLLAGRGDYSVASWVVAGISLAFVFSNEAIVHWFLLPVAACGILAGVDVVRWLRGRLDTFDPRTIVANLAFYGFFVAPLLHVAWDTFGAGYDLILRGDWRPWLGMMAALHAAGLALYRLAHNFMHARTKPSVHRWEIDERKFMPVFGVAIAIALVAQVYLLLQMGGIGGVIEAYERNKAAFEGKGWLLVFAGPLTVLAFAVVMLRSSRGGFRPARVAFLLAAVVAGHFMLMGWRGSRAATALTVVWLVGIIHCRFHKIPTKLIATGLGLLLAFMYFYGFYKERGREGFEVLRSPGLWTDPQGYRRDLKGLMLGDLARADVTAFVLYNLIQYPRDYDYRYGLTYAGALATLIPRNIWQDRPEFKVEAGTEAQHGKAMRWRSSRVYGLSGEALLNLGPWGVPFSFGIFGGILGWYRRKVTGWKQDDSRTLLVPLVTILFAAGVIGDSDNVVFAAVTHGALVFTALAIASKRQHIEKQSQPE